ncbi:MAG TPA: NAD(P)/FAD-dependent oxidoreductase [Pyrinomonadaceae bacterium]|jgi:flavin-dependent dehydrogenase|nr:NAD(P)/FAD-dependent oxidoreductase [Pyrinomonadaceae bacterium]
MYEAIIVGARVAGSPLAMLLARKGHRVLLLDKATFPSDRVSTHHIHQPGVARLRRWGLLERVRASNCPPTTEIKFDVGPFALAGTPPPAEGNVEAYAPRRRVLDKILADAAVESGAELREGFSVEELTGSEGVVTGVRGRDGAGSSVTEKARVVVGADGPRSIVASSVQAPVYLDRGMLTCNYYSYWSGVTLDGVELYPREGRMIVADKTNDGLVMVTVVWPKEEFNRVRSNIEFEFMRSLDEHAPALAERVRAGRREERFAGSGFLPNLFRKPYGEGWALVGDAGYVKDPATAQGITNAFSHAEMLAEALDEGLSGRREMTGALAGYERKRNDEVMAMFEHTCQLARLAPPPAEMIRLLGALRGDGEQTGRFLGTVVGTVPVQEFFSPENVGRIVKASALMPAA